MSTATRILRPLVAAAAALWALSAGADPAELRKLAHEHYEWRDAAFPTQTSGLGNHRYDDRLTDYSSQAIQRYRTHYDELLAKVKSMSTEGWSRDDRVDAILFQAQLEGDEFFGRTLGPDGDGPADLRERMLQRDLHTAAEGLRAPSHARTCCGGAPGEDAGDAAYCARPI